MSSFTIAIFARNYWFFFPPLWYIKILIWLGGKLYLFTKWKFSSAPFLVKRPEYFLLRLFLLHNTSLIFLQFDFRISFRFKFRKDDEKWNWILYCIRPGCRRNYKIIGCYLYLLCNMEFSITVSYIDFLAGTQGYPYDQQAACEIVAVGSS